jgi:hypothetical protein
LPEIFGKIIEFLTRASPRVFGALFLFCLIVLVLPARALSWLNLASLVEASRTAISLTLLGTGVYLATYPLHTLCKRGAQYVHEMRTIHIWKNRLHRLTFEEKKLLQSYLQRHTHTRRWNLGSGVVEGLVRDGILFRSSNAGSVVEGFAYNITSWAYDDIAKHPELVATPGDASEPDAFA